MKNNFLFLILFIYLEIRPFAAEFNENAKLDLLPKDCGYLRRGGKIVGGKKAVPGEFPWMALLGYYDEAGPVHKFPPVYSCGGSLISTRYVLTAAHCLASEDGSLRNLGAVRLGVYHMNKAEDTENSSVRYDVDKLIVHEHYDPENLYNDIALIRLAKEVELTKQIRTVCVPNSSNSSAEAIQPGSYVTVAGWGSNATDAPMGDVLQKVDLPIVPPAKCQSQLQEVFMKVNESLQICAGEPGKDTCSGDSGGPVITTENGEHPRKIIVGVLSFGGSNCGSGMPGVYTNIRAYFQWILEHMEP